MMSFDYNNLHNMSQIIVEELAWNNALTLRKNRFIALKLARMKSCMALKKDDHKDALVKTVTFSKF